MRPALFSLLSAALVLGGCGAKAQQIGGQLRTGDRPQVVSLSPSTSEIISSTYDSATLIGRTSSDDFPPSLSKVPVVASVKPDFERIRSIKPTLVVYDADLYNADDIKKIEGMGVESYAFKAHTVDGFEKELYVLSNKLGSETNVSGYVARIDNERRSASADSITPSPKVVVMLSGGAGSYVAGTGSFLAEIVKIAGGTLVGPDADKFAPMSSEALISAAPDVIVLSTSKASGAKDVAALQADPRLRTTPAMKAGRIIPFDGSVLTRRGNRVDSLIRDLHHELARSVQK